MINPILDTDSYKASHYLQYPPGTTSMFSYLESRGGEYPEVVFFGLRYLLDTYFDRAVTCTDVLEAAEFFPAHGEPFNRAGWDKVVREYGGRLPLTIRALPEGSVVPVGVPLLTVESTDPELFWLVSWVETVLVRLWYPITVASRGLHMRRQIVPLLQDSVDDWAADLLFKVHDFGSRGVSSSESAAIGGMSHLVNFRGSDTVAGVLAANRHYPSPMAGVSIPAAEHSTITAWNREGENAAYRNMLNQFAKPSALVATVSDSYDLWNAIDNFWGKELRQQIKDSGATIIIRPDSGDPTLTVLKAVQKLDDAFGHTMNGKGYKVLNHVRVIQGDGIKADVPAQIISRVMDFGYSAENVNFGMGGGNLQQLDRDTMQFAYKCSSVTVDGQERAIKKEPVQDLAKTSKAGRLDTVRWPNGEYHCRVLVPTRDTSDGTAMRTVYADGRQAQDPEPMDTIRRRVDKVLGL